MSQQQRPQQRSQSTGYGRRETPKADPAVLSGAIQRVQGTFGLPAEVNQRLNLALQTMNLISPATAVGDLPEGCGIAMTAVIVDTANEAYDVGAGKFALAKSALDRIAASIGVSWIPDECLRVDDGSDPHYVHFRVAGRYRAFDGQVQVITAHKEMDLRDGSPTWSEIEAQVRKANNHPKVRSGEWKPRDPVNQIRQMRAHILAHAESKAKLRAVRSLGVRSSYTAEELSKPFICARIMFTGKTTDPELKQLFASKTADAFLDGTHTVYGGSGGHHAPPVHVDRQLVAASSGHAPPTVGSVQHDPEDYPEDPIDAHGEDTTSEAAAIEHVIPGGRNKGTPLGKASDQDLGYWKNRIGEDLNNGNSRDEDRDAELYAALTAELNRRGVGGGQAADSRQTELKT